MKLLDIKKISLNLFLLLFFINASKAQITNVNVSINVIAPYSPYIIDYINNPNKAIITLIPNGTTISDQVTVYFKASIIGDNGVSMVTKTGYKPPQGLNLVGNFPKILNAKTLSEYFSENNLIFNGVTLKELVNGNGLPEGDYTICLQVFDYNTDLPLSQMAPMGCSAPIQIQHVDPPLAISPICQGVVNVSSIQNVMFNWTYNPGVSAQVQYLLKIVPILPTQNPNDAINTMVTPAFFEKIVKSTTYLYGPSDPQLIKGQKYAYRIKAFDPTNKTMFKNNGESEVCWFIYGNSDSLKTNQKNQFTKKPKKEDNIFVQGNMNYYFGQKNKTSEHALSNQSFRVIKAMAMAPVFETTRFDSKTNKKYKIDSFTAFSPTIFIAYKSTPETPDVGKVLTTGTTDEVGNFSINFEGVKTNVLSDQELGMKNYFFNEGQLYKYVWCYYIDINNNYFADPWGVIVLENGEKKNGLKIEVPIRQYSLEVTMKSFLNEIEYYTKKTTPVSGKYQKNINVYLLRKPTKKPLWPQNEGDIKDGKPLGILTLTPQEGGFKDKNGNMSSYQIISQKTITIGQKVVFENLIQNIYKNQDEYFLMARIENTQTFFSPQSISFNECAFGDCQQTPNLLLFEMSKTPTIHKVEYSAFQSVMQLSGKMTYAWGLNDGIDKKPLPNIQLNLVGSYIINSGGKTHEYSTGNTIATTTTNSDGYYKFENIGAGFLHSLGGQQYNWNKKQTKEIIDQNGNKIIVTGDVNYVLRIKVSSPYYYSPDNDLLVEPGYAYDVGEMTALVRECNPTFNRLNAFNPSIESMKDLKNLPPKGGERIYLMRKTNKIPSGYPLKINALTKSKYISSSGVEYTIISETITNNDGTYSFKNIPICNLSNSSDYYSLYSESPDNSMDNYQSMVQNYVIVKDEIESKSYTNSNIYLKSYNSQKKIVNPIIDFKFATLAQKPIINGAVYPQSNFGFNPLSEVKATIYDLPENFIYKNGVDNLKQFFDNLMSLKLENTITTGENGKFEFNPETKSGFSGRKAILFYKKGFNISVVFILDGKKITNGQKIALNKVTLGLPMEINASFKNQKGEFVEGKVIVGDDFSWAEAKNNYSISKIGNEYKSVVTGQNCQLKVPNSKIKITFYPNDNNSYSITTKEFDFVKDNVKKIEMKVDDRAHTFSINVKDKNSKLSIPSTVEVLNINPIVEFKSYNFMGLNFNFVKIINAETDFKLRISSPGYAAKLLTVKDPNYDHLSLEVELEKEQIIKGTVSLDLLVLKNAKVFIKSLPSVKEVLTAENGSFKLEGISSALTQITVTVLPPDGVNAVGITKVISLPLKENMVIKLNSFKEFDVTNLYGFPMQVSKINFVNNEYIANFRIKLNSNKVFSSVEEYLYFNDIKLKASTTKNSKDIPLCETVFKTIYSSTLYTNINVYNEYLAKLSGNKGIEMERNKTNANINGTVKVLQSAFDKGIDFNQAGFYLYNKNYNGKTNEILTVFFTSPSSDMPYFDKGFKISGKDNSNILCKINNKYENCELMTDNSSFNDVGIKANLILHTQISSISEPDINLNLGEIYINKKDGPLPKLEDKNLKINMGKWQFDVNKFEFTPSGLITSGNIMVGLFAVPAKNVLIDFKEIKYGEYKTDKIKLGGSLPINLNPANTTTSFGFDKGYGPNGAWSLVMLPTGNNLLTSLINLPNLATNDKIDLQSISLYSNGDDVIMISPQTPTVTLNKIASFKPTQAYIFPSGLKFRGTIDFKIPKFPELAPYDLSYDMKNGNLTYLSSANITDVNYKAIVVNTQGVKLQFDANNQIFSDNKLSMTGTITDHDPKMTYSFKYKFIKSISSTGLVIDESIPQKFLMSSDGSKGMEKIKGNMNVKLNNNEWDFFRFNGELFGYNGVEGKKNLAFEVKGDMVANGSEVGVKNMDVAGLGKMSLTFDIEQSAVIGTLNIDRSFETFYLKADIETKFGSSGWFIFGAGELEIYDVELPVKRFKAGFFVGMHKIMPNHLNIFKTFFYKQELPEYFPKGEIKGIVMGGAVAFPIPKVPQINIPLDPVVHVVLEHQINLNGYFAINFAGDPTISAGVQVYVYVHLGAGASIGLACAGADFKVTAGAKGEAQIKKSLDFNLKATAFLELTGSAYVGAGFCDNNCDDLSDFLPGCYTTSFSKNITIDFELELKRENGDFDFDMGFKNVKY